MKFGEGKSYETQGNKNMQESEINVGKLANGGSIRLRLVGNVNPAFRYWVKNRADSPRPKLTPFFNKDTENISSDDPLLGKGQKEFFYTINCIERVEGAPAEMKILIMKTSIYQYLSSLALDEDYGNPADPVTGRDIIITKESTGPKVMNVKYNILPRPAQSPLTPEELALPLHDLAAIYDPGNKESYIEWVRENTTVLDGLIAAEAVAQSNSEDIPY